MKKLLAITLTIASFGFLGLGSADVNANGITNASPQIRVRVGPQRHRGYRNNMRFRTVRQSRIVRRGSRTYRETYLVRYFGNGQTSTTLISRERIG